MKYLKKIMIVLYFSGFSMILFSSYAEAYIDPSALTYVIQAVAGVFIAGGAAVGIYWHKIKRFFKTKRNEKRHKGNKNK